MSADGPVERGGCRLEVCEQGYGAFELGQFAGCDGRETRVVEGAVGWWLACLLQDVLTRKAPWSTALRYGCYTTLQRIL